MKAGKVLYPEVASFIIPWGRPVLFLSNAFCESFGQGSEVGADRVNFGLNQLFSALYPVGLQAGLSLGFPQWSPVAVKVFDSEC